MKEADELAAVAEIAGVVNELLDTLIECDTALAVRAVSSCLSIVVVNTAPSKEAAEDIIKSLCDTILEIIQNADDQGVGNWNDSEGHTLQ